MTSPKIGMSGGTAIEARKQENGSKQNDCLCLTHILCILRKHRVSRLSLQESKQQTDPMRGRTSTFGLAKSTQLDILKLVFMSELLPFRLKP